MSKRVVSQEAFDEVVRENMDEFEMDVDEAIADAVQQFEAQNVDLSLVVRDMVRLQLANTSESNASPDAVHPLVSALDGLDDPSAEPSVLFSSLRAVREGCEAGLAQRVLAGRHNAMPRLFALLQAALSRPLAPGVADAVLEALGALLDGQPDVVTAEQLAALVALLRPDAAPSLTQGQRAAVLRLLRLACIRHEANRCALVELEIIPVVVDLLGAEPERQTVREVCGLLQALTLDDDIRVPFGKAHDHAKAIVTETPVLEVLLRLCREFNLEEDHEVVADAFATLSKLSVRNEFCQTLLDFGGVALILEALANHVSKQAIVRTALQLLKALAGNDNVKTEVGRCGGITVVVESLRRFVPNPAVAQNGCAALAAICLRQPDNAERAVDAGAPAALEQILKVHSEHEEVLRQVCHAVRTVVSRRPDLQPAFLSGRDFEALLNAAPLRLCPDEAKAALRDLGCAVALRELWTGERGHLAQD